MRFLLAALIAGAVPLTLPGVAAAADLDYEYRAPPVYPPPVYEPRYAPPRVYERRVDLPPPVVYARPVPPPYSYAYRHPYDYGDGYRPAHRPYAEAFEDFGYRRPHRPRFDYAPY